MRSQVFAQLLLQWYGSNARDLPWRREPNPYYIWLSEIILQQTQVKQGLPYFNRFIKRFPRLQDLAESSEQEVLKQWQGLGYYSRARNSHRAARYLCAEHQGHLPQNYNQLLQVPGIGPYTAGAIASMAFGLPEVAVDGNVQRVLARLLGIDEPVNRPAGLKRVQEAAQNLLYRADPGRYNQALMEFGALHCKPQLPLCASCPFAEYCVANRSHRVQQLPLKIKNIKQRTRYWHVLPVKNAAGAYYLRRRAAGDVMEGLYELFTLESPGATLKAPHAADLLAQLRPYRCVQQQVHKLSHQTLQVFVYRLTKTMPRIKGYRAYSTKQLKALPVSGLMAKIIKDLQI